MANVKELVLGIALGDTFIRHKELYDINNEKSSALYNYASHNIDLNIVGLDLLRNEAIKSVFDKISKSVMARVAKQELEYNKKIASWLKSWNAELAKYNSLVAQIESAGFSLAKATGYWDIDNETVLQIFDLDRQQQYSLDRFQLATIVDGVAICWNSLKSNENIFFSEYDCASKKIAQKYGKDFDLNRYIENLKAEKAVIELNKVAIKLSKSVKSELDRVNEELRIAEFYRKELERVSRLYNKFDNLSQEQKNAFVELYKTSEKMKSFSRLSSEFCDEWRDFVCFKDGYLSFNSKSRIGRFSNMVYETVEALPDTDKAVIGNYVTNFANFVLQNTKKFNEIQIDTHDHTRTIDKFIVQKVFVEPIKEIVEVDSKAFSESVDDTFTE